MKVVRLLRRTSKTVHVALRIFNKTGQRRRVACFHRGILKKQQKMQHAKEGKK
jgi:hypothetical protein